MRHVRMRSKFSLTTSGLWQILMSQILLLLPRGQSVILRNGDSAIVIEESLERKKFLKPLDPWSPQLWAVRGVHRIPPASPPKSKLPRPSAALSDILSGDLGGWNQPPEYLIGLLRAWTLIFRDMGDPQPHRVSARPLRTEGQFSSHLYS